MTSTSSLHCLKRGSRPAAGCCACVARARACVLCVCVAYRTIGVGSQRQGLARRAATHGGLGGGSSPTSWLVHSHLRRGVSRYCPRPPLSATGYSQCVSVNRVISGGQSRRFGGSRVLGGRAAPLGRTVVQRVVWVSRASGSGAVMVARSMLGWAERYAGPEPTHCTRAQARAHSPFALCLPRSARSHVAHSCSCSPCLPPPPPVPPPQVSASISCSERMVKCICEKGTMVSGVRCRTLVLVFGVG